MTRNETTRDPHQVASWQDALRRGQLAEALGYALAAAEDPVTEGLDTLTRLLEALRAKRYSQAQALADRAAVGLADALPELAHEVAALVGSAQRLEKGEVDAALEQLAQSHAAIFAAERATLEGTARVYQARDDEAEVALKRALELDPKHYRAATNLGNVLLETGRVDEAIMYYERALALNEHFANAHHNLGVAYRRKGQLSKSVASIRRAAKASRLNDREDARSLMRGLGQRRGGNLTRWLLWGVAAGALYLVLRAQGIL